MATKTSTTDKETIEFVNDDDDDHKVENKNNAASIQATLQVQFITKIADKSMQCDDTEYALTSKIKPTALSQVVNHVLKKNDDESIDFDFLIDNVYVTKTLAEHLSEHDISSEETIQIEYIEKTIEPSAKSSSQHPDWVSCVDAIRNNLFITGCYDGIIRVWSANINHQNNSVSDSNTNLFSQHRGHIAPIKGITALYSVLSTNNIYYFATVAKDRSVKVFGLNETTKQIKQVGKIDNKSATDSHRFAAECISAPFPSKVFATGSADKEIKIYRLKNKDVLDDKDGPPMKKRKLNNEENAENEDDDIKINDGDGDEKGNRMEWSKLANISTLRGHRNVVKCIDWSNPYALYSGSWDNCIKLWDVKKEIDTFTWSTQSAVTCLKYWSAQNVLISAHSNQKIAIWDPRTDRKLENKTMSEMTFRSHRLPITGLDVDGAAGIDNNRAGIKNSDYLFISSSHDGKLKIWDIRSQSPLYTVSKHKGKALCVGWYGNTIVSGGSDNKLHSFKWKK